VTLSEWALVACFVICRYPQRRRCSWVPVVRFRVCWSRRTPSDYGI